jgi:predicted PurR-regulated permease PerM
VTAAGNGRAYRVTFLLVVAAGLALLALAVLRPFAAAIAWAIVLAVGLRGPWRWIERRLASRRGLAAGVAALLAALMVLLPAVALGTVLFEEASQAARWIAAELRGQRVTSLGDVVAHPIVAGTLDWLQRWTGVAPATVQSRVGEAAASLSALVAQKSGGFVLGFLDALLTFATTIFLLFFFLRDGDTMIAGLADLLPIEPGQRERIVRDLGAMLQAIFRGSLLCALVQGASGGIGWVLAGLPSPVLAGALMAVLSLLPFGGTALVWGPGVLWCWASGRPGAALFLLLWGTIVTAFVADNLLRPVLLRGAGELNTLVVFLGVFGGLSAFGLLGIFIGPIVLALSCTVVDVLRVQARQAREPEPG